MNFLPASADVTVTSFDCPRAAILVSAVESNVVMDLLYIVWFKALMSTVSLYIQYVKVTTPLGDVATFTSVQCAIDWGKTFWFN